MRGTNIEMLIQDTYLCHGDTPVVLRMRVVNTLQFFC